MHNKLTFIVGHAWGCRVESRMFSFLLSNFMYRYHSRFKSLLQSAELEDWDDSAGAWEDEDLTLEAEQALRQSRKDERERRLAEHQRRNQAKEQKKSKDSSRLATKLS